MESLENQVREGLIQKRADELYQQTQKPEYQKKVKNVLKIMSDFMSDEDFGHSFGSMEESIGQLISNPEQLKQQLYQQSQQIYMTREQWKATVEDFYNELNKDGNLGDEAMIELQKANEGVYHFFDLRSRTVKSLTEIAEKEGLENALTDEAENKVTREIFPTKDEYVTHCIGGIQSIKDYFAHGQQAMMMDGELGQIIGAVYSGMQKVIEEIKEMSDQTVKEKILEKAQEIYGA